MACSAAAKAAQAELSLRLEAATAETLKAAAASKAAAEADAAAEQETPLHDEPLAKPDAAVVSWLTIIKSTWAIEPPRAHTAVQ